MTQPTCENCRWWEEPKPVSARAAWVSDKIRNQSNDGSCLNAMNDICDLIIGTAPEIRVVASSRAEHSCTHWKAKDTAK